MTLLLTLLALVLAAAIVALLAWEVRHRRSDLVAAWNPSTYPGRVTGGLGMLEGGTVSDRLGPGEPEVVVLLHGLGATADYFGDVYEGIGRTRRLVMPDLLGFGRSLDERRHDFSLETQVAALERGLDAIGVGGARLAIAGGIRTSEMLQARCARVASPLIPQRDVRRPCRGSDAGVSVDFADRMRAAGGSTPRPSRLSVP